MLSYPRFYLAGYGCILCGKLGARISVPYRSNTQVTNRKALAAFMIDLVAVFDIGV